MVAHTHEAESEQVFACEYVDAWEVINLLVQVHAKESIGLDFAVSPPDVPITRPLIFLYDPSKFLSDLLNNRVLSVGDVYNDLFGLRFVAQLGNRYVFGTVVGVDFVGGF